MRRVLFFTLAVMLAAAAGAKVSFRIVRGSQDTVFKPSHVVVGVTDAANKVKVNGKDAHVYKTGAFGAQISLKKGANQVAIEVSDGNETQKKVLDVYLADKPESKKTAPVSVCEEFDTPLYVSTIDGAYLQYGDGGDRLGGSKMGELPKGVILKAVAQKDGLYKVRLSQNRFAFIPENLVLPSASQASLVNSGSWSISNEGKCDRVSISLPGRLPFRSWTQLDPTMIYVEVFGVMNNSNWITQRGDLGAIEYVDCRQDDSDVLKVVIKMKEEHLWGYAVDYKGNNLVVEVKHSPSLDLSAMTIGLDAGHGGKSLGARSTTGLLEKDVNLDIVRRMARLLEEKEAKVVLSRDDDTGPSMSERKKTFRDAGVDLVVSVHNNSGGSPLAYMGTSTYYKHIFNRELAQCMLNRLLELDLRNFGLTGNFNFSLNAPTDYPNVLLEVLFMSSLPEEEKLADPHFRQQVAEKAVLGLEDYLEKVKKSR